MTSDWTYNGEPFDYDKAVEDGFIGFVYCITDPMGMKYIGKKLIITTRKLPPLKGMKRKRKKIVETDWRTYWGSGEAIPALLIEHGAKGFTRDILHLCKTKGELGYKELLEQTDRRVLEKPEEYHNGIIQCRIHRNHVLRSSD